MSAKPDRTNHYFAHYQILICHRYDVSSWKKFTKKVNFYGSEVLSGDAVRPGKNAARVLLGSVESGH